MSKTDKSAGASPASALERFADHIGMIALLGMGLAVAVALFEQVKI